MPDAIVESDNAGDRHRVVDGFGRRWRRAAIQHQTVQPPFGDVPNNGQRLQPLLARRQQVFRQARPVGGHVVVGLHGSEGDDVFVGTAVAHDTDR